MYIFELAGPPIPHKQPRLGRGNVYSPDRVHYEKLRWQLKPTAPRDPFCGPVGVEYTWFVPIPKGVSATRRRQMLNRVILPDNRPDDSNYLYFLDNLLETVVYDDDKRICERRTFKVYGDPPRTVIKVWPIITSEQYGITHACNC